MGIRRRCSLLKARTSNALTGTKLRNYAAAACMLQEEMLDVNVKQELESEIYPRIEHISSAVNNMMHEVCKRLTEGSQCMTGTKDRL